MAQDSSVYDEFDVPTVVNGVGNRTQISGSRMRPEAAEAMARASERYVYITELQARASELIADVTGAEAGFVTTGATAGLALGTAACIAGDDYAVMDRLPNTDGIPSEVIIPRAHVITYDVGYRAAGADLVEFGRVTHEPVAGGVDAVEPWEIESAISEDTVAVGYVQKPHNLLSLADLADVAHDHGLPVVVDAAAELPPTENLRRFIDQGADLVSFSGGKAIRGPQSTGILAGRRDLIQSAALQALSDGYHEALWDPPSNLIDADELPGLPRYGLGRGLKVGKEELLGLMRALELFVEEDDDALVEEWRNRVELIAGTLAGTDGLDVTVTGTEGGGTPGVLVRVDPDRTGVSAVELLRALREEDPHVWLGEDRASRGEVTVDPRCLTDEEAEYLADRIVANVS